MKASIVFTGSGPLLILTTYASLIDPEFVEKLEAKGIKKFIAREVPLDLVIARYGALYTAVVNDVKQTDDLRVLDYNGYSIFHTFSFSEMGETVVFEPERLEPA